MRFDDRKTELEELYLKYRNLMYAIAFRILNNEADAEDAVHQAFLSIFTASPGITDVNDSKTRSFVSVVVRNKALNILKKKQRCQVVDIEDIELADDADESCNHSLADGISRLPVRMRDILLLRYDNGFSVSEIAKMLGMTKSAVQKTLTRGKQKLKAYMEEKTDEK